MKLILFNLCLALMTTQALADECTYLHGKATESLSLKPMGDQSEILQLRFKGPVADRYLKLSKLEENGLKRTYLQFATRENQNAFLRVSEQPKIKIVMTMLMGGNHYAYLDGKITHLLTCTREATESP